MGEYSWILQLVTSIGIGIIGFFLAGFISDVKKDKAKTIEKIEQERKESLERDNELTKQINDLNTSMPFIYVLKEDWIRVSNATEEKIKGIDNKIDKILDILGTNKKDKEGN